MKLDFAVAGYMFYDNKLLLIHHNKLDKGLPVGGHIDPDETPDYALKREFKEETNIDIEILNIPKVEIKGDIVKNLATPFHVNTHNVGDHNHCGFYYICTTTDINNIKLEEGKINDYKFFTKEEIKNSKEINTDVKNQCLMGFDVYKELMN